MDMFKIELWNKKDGNVLILNSVIRRKVMF